MSDSELVGLVVLALVEVTPRLARSARGRTRGELALLELASRQGHSEACACSECFVGYEPELVIR